MDSPFADTVLAAQLWHVVLPPLDENVPASHAVQTAMLVRTVALALPTRPAGHRLQPSSVFAPAMLVNLPLGQLVQTPAGGALPNVPAGHAFFTMHDDC
jgi:hypothetical protein